MSGKIDSSLLLGQFSLLVPARETRSPEFLFVPPSRVKASMSTLFSRLTLALNTFFTESSIFIDKNEMSEMSLNFVVLFSLDSSALIRIS